MALGPREVLHLLAKVLHLLAKVLHAKALEHMLPELKQHLPPALGHMGLGAQDVDASKGFGAQGATLMDVDASTKALPSMVPQGTRRWTGHMVARRWTHTPQGTRRRLDATLVDGAHADAVSASSLPRGSFPVPLHMMTA